MSFDPQDPKWTAYVVGELNQAERAAVEDELQSSPAARRLVDELRTLVDSVTKAVASEPTPSLSLEQRRTLLSAASTGGATPLAARQPQPWGKLVFAFAAGLLVAAFFLPALQPARQLGRGVSAPVEVADASGAPGGNGEDYDAPDAQNMLLAHTPAEPTERTAAASARFPHSLVDDPFAEQGGGVSAKNAALAGGAANSPASTDNLSRSVRRQKGMAEPLSHAELSSIPSADDQPIVYPDAQFWQQLTIRRKKFAATDLTRGGENLQETPAKDSRPDTRIAGDKSAPTTGDVSPAALETESLTLNSSLYGRGIVDAEKQLNVEAYEPIIENPFLQVADNVLSTFSVDVNTASYSNLRRFLLQNRQLPPPSAVRIEEMLNYFPYQYAPPKDETPFAVHTEVAACPWNGEHRLLRIGIKGREIAADRRPASNLVFLLDVSGSMDEPNKLPLVKDATRLLIRQLGENDRVAIVVYAGNSGLVLPSTTGDQKTKILAALDNLQAGGSTNGGQGIQLAYDIAAGNFIKGGANRVILATDGDFNVGVTDRGDLIRLIEEKAKTGVFLTTLGFGMGNLKDDTLEQLADKGNGVYGYIDNLREARKMFVEQMSGTLVTIAKDVKLQLEFNPGRVAEYRLIGYENRALKNEDFNDDKKDAGDIGAGHTVTALYELVPAGGAAAERQKAEQSRPKVNALKYSRPVALTAAAQSDELLTLKLRYKQPEAGESRMFYDQKTLPGGKPGYEQPEAGESRLIEHVVKDDGQPYAKASVDFKFASAVALFGMLLRDSAYHGKSGFDAALELAEEGRGDDQGGYRAELLELLRTAKQLKSGR